MLLHHNYVLFHRAGRDGNPSLSVLYASNQDLKDSKKLEKGVRQGAVASVAAYIQVHTIRITAVVLQHHLHVYRILAS